MGKSRNSIWKPKQVILRLREKNDTTAYGVFYDLNYRAFQQKHVHLVSDNVLSLNNESLWIRKASTKIIDHRLQIAYESSLSENYPFFFSQFDSVFSHLRIHSFWPNYKEKLDALIKENRKNIQVSGLLILDLRGVEGDSPAFF
jgi:hypothetical protein